jgi:hypothetical protein
LTALNLFTTKFDQVLGLIEKRADTVEWVLDSTCVMLHIDCHGSSHVILDTPGQIEIFTWSASGAIITDAIASSLPTVVAYIIDTPRTTAPATFMSNMLYACRCVLLRFVVYCLLYLLPQYPIQDKTPFHSGVQQNRRAAT